MCVFMFTGVYNIGCLPKLLYASEPRYLNQELTYSARLAGQLLPGPSFLLLPSTGGAGSATAQAFTWALEI